jgi:hypothetical protein
VKRAEIEEVCLTGYPNSIIPGYGQFTTIGDLKTALRMKKKLSQEIIKEIDDFQIFNMYTVGVLGLAVWNLINVNRPF